MKNITSLGFAALIVAGCFAATAVFAQATTDEVDPVAKRKSVFETKPGFSDPFFPKRKAATTKTPTDVVKAVGPYEGIILNGINIGAGGKRFAMINNTTIAAGETDYVRTQHGRVRISCLDVKETSAVIQAEGQPPKEVFLKRTF